MRCETYEDLVAAHVDHALSALEQQEVEHHLTACERCQRLFDAQSSFRAALSARRLITPMPVEAERRLRAMLTAEVPSAPIVRPCTPVRERLRMLLPRPRFRLGLTAASILVVLLLSRLFSSAPELTLFSQAIESHQAAAEGRLALAYPASDPQQLQTAFNLSGQLDFITHIADLRSAGYQLKGGSAAQLQGHPAALTVYEGTGDLVICLRQGGKLPAMPRDVTVTHNHYVYTQNGYTIVCSQFQQHFCLLISRLPRDVFLQRLGAASE